MKCYVYLIVCNPKLSRPYVKVGMANNPQERIDTLQTGNPHELRMLACIPCKDRNEAKHLESFMHKKLCASRVRGEWFKTNGGDLNSQLLEMAKMKGIPEIIDARYFEEFNSKERATIKRQSKKIKNLNKKIQQLEKSRSPKRDSPKLESARKIHKRALMDKLISLGVSWVEIKQIIKDSEAIIGD